MTIKISCFSNSEEFSILYALIFKLGTKQSLFHQKTHDLMNTLNLQFLRTQVLTSPNEILLFLSFYEKILLFRQLCRIPISVAFTFDFLKEFSQPNLNINLISLNLIRTLNQIVDQSQNTKSVVSFVQILKKIGFNSDMADMISETRHAIVHKVFPPSEHILISSIYLFLFLKENFWDKSFSHCLSRLCNLKLTWATESLAQSFPTETSIQLLEKTKNSILQSFKIHSKVKIEKSSVREQLRKLHGYLSAELSSSNPEMKMICSIIKGSKIPLKKYRSIVFLLHFCIENPGKCSEMTLDAIQKYFEQFINVSEFRSFFLKDEFRTIIRRILIESETNSRFSNLWKFLENNFKTILFRSTFVKLWCEKSLPPQEYAFEKKNFDFLDKKYNLIEISEIVSSYCHS